MAHIITNHPFDMDVVAEQFHGLLTFRGAPSLAAGPTEIEGDVPEDALIAAVQRAQVGSGGRIPGRPLSAGLPRKRNIVPALTVAAGAVAGAVSSALLRLL